MITAFASRACIFPLFLRSMDTTARLSALKPVLDPISERLRQAGRDGNRMAQQDAQAEMLQAHARAGIRYQDMLIPMLSQGMLAYCGLKLLRAMANLPVPGFQDGGILWFADLTVRDPYLVLPLLMAGTMHGVVRLGGDTAVVTQDNPSMRMLMLYVMPVGVFLSMAWFPAAVNLWLGTTGAFAMVQARLFQRNNIRAYFGLAPIVPPEPKVVTPSPASGHTINVSGTSRPSGDLTSIRYQAPNPSSTGGKGKESAGEDKSESSGILGAPSKYLADTANAAGAGWSTFKKDVRERYDGYMNKDDGSKYDKSGRSKEFMRRAQAYERRTRQYKERERARKRRVD